MSERVLGGGEGTGMGCIKIYLQSSMLSVNHEASPVHHLLVNLLPLLLVCISAQFWVQRLQGDADNVHITPHRHTGVAMFSQDPAVTAQRLNPQPFSDKVMEPI